MTSGVSLRLGLGRLCFDGLLLMQDWQLGMRRVRAASRAFINSKITNQKKAVVDICGVVGNP
jgi:hypothetical protein